MTGVLPAGVSWRHVTRYARYVRHRQVEDYCRMGWCACNALEGTPHAAYGVLCVWLCPCPPIEPGGG
jgi:hypothetical protein